MHQLQIADYIVIAIYFIGISLYGYYIFKHKKKKNATHSKDFFLAEGSLTWWAIGASIIASNISAEHFIGMSGSGFAIGLAISSYEWTAGIALILVAIFILPVYIKNQVFTMPQFLSVRYDNKVSTIMAVFWLLVYVFVNLTSIIYLGALAISSISDLSFGWSVALLSSCAVIVTLGGMKVIGYTDVIQVVVLVIGGLITTYLALDLLANKLGLHGNVWKALGILRKQAPEHFHLILKKTNQYYRELPGISVLIGGMLVNNIAYFGCNQYIVQRTLGADLDTARKGILFSAFLKLLIPIIAVLPGITMYILHQKGLFVNEMTDSAGMLKPDHAYPTLMNLLPTGLKGVAFAALTAAVVASLAGKANSISTIFSMDIYKKFINPNASEIILVKTGRYVVIGCMLVAAIIAPTLKSLDQAYQFIQEYVGFFSPGVLSIFILGMFWKKATASAALTAAIMTIPLSVILKFLPVWSDGYFPEIPFLNRMLISFFLITALMIIISLVDKKGQKNINSIIVEKSYFKISTTFIICSILILGILTALYTAFW